MLRYTLKRFLSLLISLAIASLVIFAVIEVAPGDPASFMLGINAQEDTLAALRTELGLDLSEMAAVSGMGRRHGTGRLSARPISTARRYPR